MLRKVSRVNSPTEAKRAESIRMPALDARSVGHDLRRRSPSMSPVVVTTSGRRAFSGLALAAGSALAYSLASVITKILTGMPVWQIGFFQLGLMFILAYCCHQLGSRGKNGNVYETPFGKDVLKRSGWKLTIRGLAGASALLLRAVAVQLLPIGDATAIAATSPVFVALIAWVYLRERVGYTTLVCLLLTLTGSFLVAKPEFIFGHMPMERGPQPALWVPPLGPLKSNLSDFKTDNETFYTSNRAVRPLNGNNLSVSDYNQLKIDTELDRHPMAMATDFQRPLNSMFAMLAQGDTAAADPGEHPALKFRDNSAALTPRLRNEPLKTVEDLQKSYSSNEKALLANDRDFHEMPELLHVYGFENQRDDERRWSDSLHRVHYTASDRSIGILVALISAVIQAGVYVCVRTMRNENPNVIIMYSGLSGAVLCLALSFVTGTWIPVGANHLWLPVLGVGIFAFASQFAMTSALRVDKANVVSLARASDVLWGYAWQIIIFRETPDATSILGALFILGSVVMLTLDRVDQQLSEYQRQQNERRRASPTFDEDSRLLTAYDPETQSLAGMSMQKLPTNLQPPPPPYDSTDRFYEQNPPSQRSQGGGAYRRPSVSYASYQRDQNYEPI